MLLLRKKSNKQNVVILDNYPKIILVGLTTKPGSIPVSRDSHRIRVPTLRTRAQTEIEDFSKRHASTNNWLVNFIKYPPKEAKVFSIFEKDLNHRINLCQIW